MQSASVAGSMLYASARVSGMSIVALPCPISRNIAFTLLALELVTSARLPCEAMISGYAVGTFFDAPRRYTLNH